MSNLHSLDNEHVTLCEVLDRILNKGAVVVGEVRISVADIDLIYLGLQLVLTSIESAREPVLPQAALRVAPLDGEQETGITRSLSKGCTR
jgi:hypothetical protein